MVRGVSAEAEAAFEQLTVEQLAHVAGAEGNSVVTLVWHISGNLKSRFTEFLRSDGEKLWRQRESEFDLRKGTHRELRQKGEEGWNVLFTVLKDLSDANFGTVVSIRGQALPVRDALHRSMAHMAYHVG